MPPASAFAASVGAVLHRVGRELGELVGERAPPLHRIDRRPARGAPPSSSTAAAGFAAGERLGAGSAARRGLDLQRLGRARPSARSSTSASTASCAAPRAPGSSPRACARSARASTGPCAARRCACRARPDRASARPTGRCRAAPLPAFLTRLCRKSKPGTSLPKTGGVAHRVSSCSCRGPIVAPARRARAAALSDRSGPVRRCSRAGAAAPAGRSGRSCAGCRRRRTPAGRPRAACRSPRRASGLRSSSRRFIDGLLGGGVEAVAPALVALELGEVAVGPGARPCARAAAACGRPRARRGRWSTNSIVAARVGMRSAAICASGVSSEMIGLAEVARDEREDEIDRVGRIEPVAARRHDRQRRDLELGREARARRRGSTHSAAMRRSSRAASGAGSAVVGAARAALVGEARQHVGVEHVELEREHVAGAERRRRARARETSTPAAPRGSCRRDRRCARP